MIKQHETKKWWLPAFLGLALAISLPAQTAAKAEPDVLELNDGEKLIGKLVSATGDKLVFHSDAAGDVTVDWAKVKNLKSSAKFAVAEKGVVMDRHTDLAKVPQGTVTAADQKLEITPASGAPVSVPVANAANVVPQDNFLGAFKRQGLGHGWHGTAGLGIDIVRSTQRSRNITVGVALSRTVSDEAWIAPRYRTTFGFNLANGQLSQTGQATLKTDIIHANLEHDLFINRRLFAFGQADWLHSLSQGMKLQQTYGAGLGYVVLKDEHQELDVKGSIAYVHQAFEPAIPVLADKSLIGAILGETYRRSFEHGITLNQGFNFIPAFNDSSAYSFNTFLNLGIPISKRFNVTVGALDAYINEPPAGFQKNSFQFVTQLAYKIN